MKNATRKGSNFAMNTSTTPHDGAHPEEDRFNPWLPEMERKMEQITSSVALRLAHYLCRIRRYSDATARVSRRRIAEVLNVSVEGVRKALNVLRDEGLIAWETQHRKASLYRLLFIRPAKSSNEGGPKNSRSATDVASRWATDVASIPEGSSFQKKDPPTPRGRVSDQVTGSDRPERGGRIISSSNRPSGQGCRPAPSGDRWGLMDRRRAEDRAAEMVPEVAGFDALDEVVARSVGVNADGQAVMDWDLHRRVEGRGSAGLPQSAIPGVVSALTGGAAASNVSPRVWGRFASSVAAMGRWGEITGLMLSRAVDQIQEGRRAVDVAAWLYRQVMINRFNCREMKRWLLLQTDEGARPYAQPFSHRFAFLADVVEGREIPVGEKVVVEEVAA